jgi:4-amino-4-deoxy-L-arabinose transferase-like glycosyltransferase
MFRSFNHRAGHYLLLLLVWAALCLPNLGRPSLWDIDEGNNAEAAFEMRESGNWLVPTFNYRLRPDKPALLYWLQAGAYAIFGVNEFAARLPSALASLLSVLLTYELGRRTFGIGAGLLAALILASTVSFCAAAHFANPDALLNACTILTMFLFWRDYRRGKNGWLVWTGISTGLGMMAKGPVGVVLPSAVTILFLLWSGRLRRGFHPLLLGGVAAFLLTAGPWYVWVGAETKGLWTREFFLVHNWFRALREPMENHGGPIYYYAIALIAGFAPWSGFFGLTAWHAAKTWLSRGSENRVGSEPARFSEPRLSDVRSAIRLLVCWIAVYFIAFSIAKTKLPNYVLPLYAPVALLVAHFLDQWRRGLVQPPAWVVQGSLVCLALIGIGVALGLLIASGALDVPQLRGRGLPGLEAWAALGVPPLLGAVAAWWYAKHRRPGGAIGSVAVSSILFTGALAAWGSAAVDPYKAPRALAALLPADQLERDVRVAAYDYFQPSLVFYCQREVFHFDGEQQALDFLRGPLPAYLVVPAERWEELRPKVGGPLRQLGKQFDLYKGYEVVLVTNE